jgi:hypothetical protein
VQRTWDHVFPRAWYPETTPLDLEKWHIPACLRCNGQYGKLENDLLIRFGMCIDPDKAEASGIADKALRALNPRFAKTPKDARARLREREKFIARLKPASRLSRRARFPGLAPPPTHGGDTPMAVPIPGESLRRLVEKICRGIFYINDESFIEPPYEIVHHVVDERGAAPAVEILEQYGAVFAREPGITVCRAVVPENRRAALFSIEIWGQLKLYASVLDEDQPSNDQSRLG